LAGNKKKGWIETPQKKGSTIERRGAKQLSLHFFLASPGCLSIFFFLFQVDFTLFFSRLRLFCFFAWLHPLRFYLTFSTKRARI